MPAPTSTWPAFRHTRLSAIARGVRALAFTGVLGMLGMAGIVAPAGAADVSVSKPVGQLFTDDAVTLSAAGEHWLRAQVASSATQSGHMVVVQVPGATEALQLQRASAIRQRLAVLGVAREHVYIEAAPVSVAASRVAGL